MTLAEELPDAAERVSAGLAEIDAVVSESSHGLLEITFDGRRVTPGEVIRQLSIAVPVSDLAIEETSAETIVRRLYEGELSFDADGADPDR